MRAASTTSCWSTQNLEAHELYRLADAKAVVIVTQANGDAVDRAAWRPALKALKADYARQGRRVHDAELQPEGQPRGDRWPRPTKAGYDIPILMDSNQLVGESLGVTRSAEVFVIDPKTWKVAYRGPLRRRLRGQGARRRAAPARPC